MNALTPSVPEGFETVPLDPDAGGAVRLCVLVRREADPVAGHFVVLREALDARVLLGCIIDSGGVVHRWVQVWVQTAEGVPASLEAYRSSLGNAALEARWRRTVDGVEAVAPKDLVRTGFEREHPPALFLDTSSLSLRAAIHEASGDAYEVCRDDTLLVSRGLPPYGTSLHRYLFVPSLGERSPFVPVTPEAPEPEGTTLALAQLLTGYNRSLVSFNAGGGYVLVRGYSPVTLAGYIDVFGGGAWSGIASGRSVIHLHEESAEHERSGGEQVDPDRLFLGRHGRWGRLIETLHLKLRLISDTVAGVHDAARATGRPVLNLTDESFQVELWGRACGLPRLWTARATLVDPGGAVALPIEGSRRTYFVSADGTGRGVYRPQLSVQPASGLCAVRIRRATVDEDGTVTVEGTFSTQERVGADGSDIAMLRLNLAGERTQLYVHLESEQALTAGELRFRSVPRRMPGAQAEAVRAAEGVPMSDVPFEVLPLLSSPCDLYALGVLAVRALLVDPDTTLPIALDETLSLAREVGGSGGEEPLEDRIRGAFERDRRWVDALGPQRLVRESLTPEEAFDLVPPELWWRVLAFLVRMFPGMGPESTCRDLGDDRAGALHRVFEPTMSGLDDLLVRTRSLVVIDWRYNREVHAVVRRFRTGMADPGRASIV